MNPFTTVSPSAPNPLESIFYFFLPNSECTYLASAEICSLLSVLLNGGMLFLPLAT